MTSAERDSLERAIVGALRATIRDHGPITPEHIGSAAKRILGSLRNESLRNYARPDALPSAARAMGKKRWEGVSEQDRSKQLGAAARTRWASMTKAERSAEMKRRRRLGLKRKEEG